MSSAVLAVVHWNDQPVDRAFLTKANASVQYRCPDGAWWWTDGPVGLAQADLATLPEDEPGVPVRSERYQIVADCRIDNRNEILRTLPDEYKPRQNSDAAIILAAYAAWGEACADRLLGDFAFVIWDQQRQTLFAARDISGARPLYYFVAPDRLILVSELTQALQDVTVPFEINEEHIVEYLTPQFQGTMGWELGWFKGFQVLPVGHTLQAQAGHIQVHSYWDWRNYALEERTEQEAIEEYRSLLQEAVGCRLRSRHEVAFELSGGLDSTALVGFAARLGPRFHTLSLIFDEAKATDERERIQQVLDFLPLDLVTPHFLPADHLFAPSCFARDWSPGTVLGVGDLLPAEANDRLHQLAVQAGCRVIITGEMGDSLNDGAPWLYFDLLRRKRFREALRRWRVDWAYSRRQTIKQFLSQDLPLFLPWSVLQAGRLLQARFQPAPIETPEFFAPGLRRRIMERQIALRAETIKAWPIKSPAVREMLEIFLPPVSFLGRPFDDPIERRHPFTDRRLLEFSLKLPPEIKWEANRKYGSARYHHRQAMAGYVPDAVRVTNWHVDFTPAITRSMSPTAVIEWFQTHAHRHVFERGYIEPQAFYRGVAETTNVTYYVRAILCLEAWLAAISPGGQMYRLVRAG